MRKLLVGLSIIVGMAGYGYCAGAPVQDLGATSTGSIVAICVDTNPAIMLSLGTSSYTGTGFLTYLNRQKMGIGKADGPIQMEIYNNSPEPIWVGYNTSVSSTPGSNNYGRMIVSSASWAHSCSVDHYAVASASTGFKVVITQEK